MVSHPQALPELHERLEEPDRLELLGNGVDLGEPLDM